MIIIKRTQPQSDTGKDKNLLTITFNNASTN